MASKGASLGGGAGSSSMSALSRTARPSALSGASAAGGKKKPLKLDAEQIEELKEAFNLFDTDNNGQIDAKELKAALRALGFQVKKADVRKMIADIDRDEQGSISFDDFTEIMTGRMGDRDSREEIAKVFALFDHEGGGKISFRDLKARFGFARVCARAFPLRCRPHLPVFVCFCFSHRCRCAPHLRARSPGRSAWSRSWASPSRTTSCAR